MALVHLKKYFIFNETGLKLLFLQFPRLKFVHPQKDHDIEEAMVSHIV